MIEPGGDRVHARYIWRRTQEDKHCNGTDHLSLRTLSRWTNHWPWLQHCQLCDASVAEVRCPLCVCYEGTHMYIQSAEFTCLDSWI